MIDYEGTGGNMSAFEETVPVSLLEYRTLVEDAEKGRVMADGILSAMTYDKALSYGPEITLRGETVRAIFRSVYPDDYKYWLDEAKKQAEKGNGEDSDDGDL